MAATLWKEQSRGSSLYTRPDLPTCIQLACIRGRLLCWLIGKLTSLTRTFPRIFRGVQDEHGRPHTHSTWRWVLHVNCRSPHAWSHTPYIVYIPGRHSHGTIESIVDPAGMTGRADGYRVCPIQIEKESRHPTSNKNKRLACNYERTFTCIM